MPRRKEPVIPADLLDQLLVGSDAATALDQGGLLDSLKKTLAERALNAEMDHHLGQDEQAGNNRNGYGRKTVVTDTDKMTTALLDRITRTIAISSRPATTAGASKTAADPVRKPPSRC